jgi:phosphate uptake regulator
MLAGHKELEKKIEAMEEKYDKQFRVIFEAIKQLLSEEEKSKNRIGF